MAERQAEKIQWHSAFAASLRVELEADAQYLSYEEEHLLSKKPLQIDVLVIKNPDNVRIRKNIGQIFRKHNIVEYKSPKDKLNIDDFYKVYGYACLYKSDTEKVNAIRAEDITITFACYHYPREMLKCIEKERGITPKKQCDGIYYLLGDSIPMQLILLPTLSQKENFWMQILRDDLKAGGEIRDIMVTYQDRNKDKNCQAIMHTLMCANQKAVEEEKRMIEPLRELFADELKESEQRGETNLGILIHTLIGQKKYEDADRAAIDEKYRKELYKKYNIQA